MSVPSNSITLKRCGIHFDPPALVILYTSESSGSKTRRRTMPLRDFNKRSSASRLAEDLLSNTRHKKFVELMSRVQLEKLLTMIKDKHNGVSKDEILKKVKAMSEINPDEDLNKVDETVLSHKKAAMDETFERNRKRPDDPDFQYDVEVEFDRGQVETCEWDDSDSAF